MSHKTSKLRLFADYRQFYLQDEQANGDLSDAWTVQATEDQLATAPGVVGIGTSTSDFVKVEVQVRVSEPRDTISRWDHVSEASLQVKSGRLVVAGCTDYFPDAKRIEVPAGWLRARICHRFSKEEACRVQLWPAPPGPVAVRKRWVAPAAPAPPPMTSKPPRTRTKAVEQALMGNTQVALQALQKFAAAGDAAAAASVAELLAFQARWEEMLPYALQLIAQPDAVYAGNVFTDLCLLVRRAAEVRNRPELIIAAARAAPPGLKERVQACLIEGRPLDPRPDATAEQLAHYQSAVLEAPKNKRFAGKPDALSRHVFALASVFNVHDEMVKQWPAKSHLLDFDHGVATARILAQREASAAAWDIIESVLPRWHVVDSAQVAPVILLLDPALHPLMSGERCEQVLSTPRSGYAR